MKLQIWLNPYPWTIQIGSFFIEKDFYEWSISCGFRIKYLGATIILRIGRLCIGTKRK